MRRFRSLSGLLALVALCLLSQNAFSQESFKEKHNLEFVAAPLIVFNPNFGNGGGVMGMALFDMDPDDDELQASSISLAGLYSDRKSRMLGLGGTFLPNRDLRFMTGMITGTIKGELDIDGFNDTARISTEINYHLSEERQVNFRIDYAVGEGNSDGFYVGMNEAF